jgi:hypothetical protein
MSRQLRTVPPSPRRPKRRRVDRAAPSPDDAELAEKKREAAKSRRSHQLLHNDPAGWVKEYVLSKKDEPK